MRYNFKELCRPDLELFEYHRAEQLEFDFLQQQLVKAFEVNCELLTYTVKSEEVRTLVSFQEHARHMTSCFYTRMIRGHKVAECDRYSTEDQFASLYNVYLEIKHNRLLTDSHVEGLETYFSGLKLFCETAGGAD